MCRLGIQVESLFFSEELPVSSTQPPSCRLLSFSVSSTTQPPSCLSLGVVSSTTQLQLGSRVGESGEEQPEPHQDLVALGCRHVRHQPGPPRRLLRAPRPSFFVFVFARAKAGADEANGPREPVKSTPKKELAWI